VVVQSPCVAAATAAFVSFLERNTTDAVETFAEVTLAFIALKQPALVGAVWTPPEDDEPGSNEGGGGDGEEAAAPGVEVRGDFFKKERDKAARLANQRAWQASQLSAVGLCTLNQVDP
jgi:hypothetical protein